MTACNLRFLSKRGTVRAVVYRHYDGDPVSVGNDMVLFFADVKRQVPNDTRFDDPEYLAARFIVWQALRLAPEDRPLSFLGVGVSNQDLGGVQYNYDINCGAVTENPTVVPHKVR